MAVSPIFSASLAEEVGRIYEEAELRILERITKTLAAGLGKDATWWERDALQRLQTLRPELLKVIAQTNPAAAAAITRTMEEAYSVGMLAAYREVGTQAVPVAHTAAVTALAQATTQKVTASAPFILRAAEDGARRVVAEVLRGSVTGTVLRPQVIQNALNGLVKEGFARVPVGRGTMGAADYARMATRTGTAKAMIEGHVQALTDLDLNLVTIIPGPRPCETCDDWAGKVLSTDGSSGLLMAANMGASDEDVEVEVDGSLDEAEVDGVFHPNCRCAIAAFIPGITSRRGLEDRPPWDAEGYHAQQEQRGLERAIREAKELGAVAVTPEAQREAARGVREAQAAMRSHLDKHPDLKRQSAREQVLRPSDD